MILVILIIIISSCENGTNPIGVSSDTIEGTSGNLVVYDSNGNFLGYCQSYDDSKILLYSEKDYYYEIYWSGALVNGTVLFTGEHFSGIAFSQFKESDAPSANTVLVHKDKIYTYLDDNNDLIADIDYTITEYLSGTIAGLINHDSSNPVSLDENFYAFTLKLIDRTTVGIPITIVGPVITYYE